MNALLMINNLPMGGAETFLVRLAVALKRRGHKVIVSVPNHDVDRFLAAVLRDAGIFLALPWWTNGFIYRYLFKLSTILPNGASGATLVDHLHSIFLKALHRKHRFDFVNPHMTWAERRACLAFERNPLRIVSTDHGDYRWKWPANELEAKRITFSRLDALVCPSLDNLRVVEKYPWSSRCRRGVIYYGFEDRPTPVAFKACEESRPLNFCMVGRGAEKTKGWDTAIEAFRMVRQRHPGKVSLTLVGEGAALDAAVSRFDPDDLRDVMLAGYQSDPFPFMARCDVGILPTRFPGESLPLVIIEFLTAGKPVLASNTAGIPEMLQVGREIAGELLVSQNGGGPRSEQLAEAMESCMDREKLSRRAQIASIAAEKFDMQRCLEQYEHVFQTGEFPLS